MEAQYTNEVRMKYEKMIKNDKMIRPIMHISFFSEIASLIIYESDYVSQVYSVIILIVSLVFAVACTLKFYWNWRCPYCGRYLRSRLNPYNWVGVWPQHDAYCYFCHFNPEKIYDSNNNR